MSGDPQDFSDSDRAWFAALSGAPGGAPPSEAERQGQALRVALEQRRRTHEADPRVAEATSDQAMERMQQQLLGRLRSEGVFAAPPAPAAAPPASATVIEFPWWRRRRPLLAMAASLLVGVVLVDQLANRPDYGEPPETLGGAAVVAVRAAQPKAAAERLDAQLKAAGLKPGLYQRRKTYVVDVQLMAAEVPAAQPAFQAFGLVPGVGYNRVEFSAP